MTTKTPHNLRTAFSLIELSVVLVVVGLLLGGVLLGTNLLRGGEMRAVMTEYTTYTQGLRTFDQKYNAIPGDFANATGYWGKDNTNCAGDTGTATTPGTCNGNGNGSLAAASGASATGEMFQFWNQMAQAGVIEGRYTGLAGSGSAVHCSLTAGNCPLSKRKYALWAAYTDNSVAGDNYTYAIEHGNYLLYGGETAILGGSSSLGATATFTPSEAYTLDTKLDDGMPGSGNVVARFWNNACANAGAATELSSSYRLNDTTVQCSLYFLKAF